MQRQAADQTLSGGVVGEADINIPRGGGQPLPESARTYFEPRFGYDFSQVRIHTDAPAAESARAVNALAYTVAADVVFGAEQYAPETTDGKRLLAHELTHVVQQLTQTAHSASKSRAPFGHKSRRFAIRNSDRRVQRKLQMQGEKAEDFLALLLRATGQRFAYYGRLTRGGASQAECGDGASRDRGSMRRK